MKNAPESVRVDEINVSPPVTAGDLLNQQCSEWLSFRQFQDIESCLSSALFYPKTCFPSSLKSTCLDERLFGFPNSGFFNSLQDSEIPAFDNVLIKHESAFVQTHFCSPDLSSNSKPQLTAYPTELESIFRALEDAELQEACKAFAYSFPVVGRADESLLHRTGRANKNNLVISAAWVFCRMGVLCFANDNKWKLTEFGYGKQLTADIEALLKPEWTIKDIDDSRSSRVWASRELQCDETKICFKLLMNEGVGVVHERLPFPPEWDKSKGRMSALKSVAAAATLGAVWYTGFDWVPTLFGAWLAFHPDSELNSNKNRVD